MTTTPTRADYGPYQMAEHLGISRSMMDRARDLDLLLAPDLNSGRWSAALVAEIADQWDTIAAGIENHRGLGAARIAVQLTAATSLTVDRADIPALAAAGWLRVVGQYKDHPLYAVADAEILADDPAGVKHLEQLVADRHAWVAASMTRDQAAEHLGWHGHEFDRVATEQGLHKDWLDRYPRDAIEALADEDLCAQVETDRLLGPNQAAEHLEIRRVDFDYATAAGWITPTRHVRKPVGRHSTVTIPLYRTGDLDDLRWLPGINWDDVRAAKPGEPSPLREYVRKPPSRAQIVHAFVHEVAGQWGVEAFAVYLGGPGVWEIDWCPDEGGHPTRAEVEQAADDNPAVSQHRAAIRIETPAGAALRWARAMLEPGAAVILDTETTDLYGRVCEIAVIDAATGDTLLDTLVNPGESITPTAAAVHGLTDADVADAPTWGQVLPTLLEITAGKTVLAYNADYDSSVVVTHSRQAGADPAHLAAADTWGCVMNRRSDWARMWRWMPLGGGHRALDDTQVTLDVLRTMTAPERG